MNQGTFTKESFWSELEALGEDKVRENLAVSVYGDVGHKRALVLEWLRTKYDFRKDTSDLEKISIARDAAASARYAADAARDAAAEAVLANKLARSANITAKIAIAVAAIAAITSLMGLFLKSGN